MRNAIDRISANGFTPEYTENGKVNLSHFSLLCLFRVFLGELS